MKKIFVFLLAVCMLFIMCACTQNTVQNPKSNNSKVGSSDSSDAITPTIEGWWEKPGDHRENVAAIFVFYVDTDNKEIVTYNFEGNSQDEFPYTFENSVLTFDAGMLFGEIKLELKDGKLVDEQGNVQYVRMTDTE